MREPVQYGLCPRMMFLIRREAVDVQVSVADVPVEHIRQAEILAERPAKPRGLQRARARWEADEKAKAGPAKNGSSANGTDLHAVTVGPSEEGQNGAVETDRPAL